MITLVQPLPSSVCTIAVVFLVVSVSAPIGGSKDGGGPVATWKTGEWEECQIAQGACNTYTSIPVYGHKKRSVWCSNSGGSLIDDRFCEADRRPHSSLVCFGHCPRCAHHLGPWTSWSPIQCDACVGRQKRRLVCHQQRHRKKKQQQQVGDSLNGLFLFGGGENGEALDSGSEVIEEERACFSPALCKGRSTTEAIRQTAISQTSSPLRPPEALTASFVPYLHVGPWSDCQPPPEEASASAAKSGVGGQLMPPTKSEEGRKKHRRKKNKRNKQRKKNNNNRERKHAQRHFQPPAVDLPPGIPWTPDMDLDLEINYIANSVDAPQFGFQKRDVQCRGQDGEALPFR